MAAKAKQRMCADARSLFAVRSGSFVPACRSANNVLSIYAICAVLHVVPVPLLISAPRRLASPDRRQTSHPRRAALPPCARQGAPAVPPPCTALDRRKSASTAPPLCTAPDRRKSAPAVPLLCTAPDRRRTFRPRRAALPPCTRQGASTAPSPSPVPDRQQGASNVLPPCAAHDRHQILQFSPGCVMMIQ